MSADDIAGLRNMPAPLLRTLSSNMMHLSNRLQRMAENADKTTRQQLNSRDVVSRIRNASKMYLDMIDQGMSDSAALDLAASEHCLQPHQVQILVPAAKKRRKAATAAERQRSVIQAYRSGVKTRDIAVSHDVTPRTVRRILSQFREQ